MTIYEYWKNKGIDMHTIENLIDYFPENSELSDMGKEIMQQLTDLSFEEENYEQIAT